ncbi:hypothetical protein ACP70R_029368 [Stipagrostis hirtigluma subsp. patula]
MATTTFSRFSLYFCVLLLCHGSMAQLFGPRISPWQSPRQGAFRGCRFDRLQPFEPLRRIRSEAGVTEYFDDNNEQFRCAGVSVIRRVIEPQGLLVPRYSNAPGLVYIIQGSGLLGLTLPGCPATYQHLLRPYGSESQTESQTLRDEHQKIQLFRQGDVVVLPAGVVHWFFNNGDSPVVAVYVFDVNNNANQLAPRQKEFLLAGNNQRGEQMFGRSMEQQQSRQNIFSGFTTELLSDALGISPEAARRLQHQNDQRGEIIQVQRGLQLLNPPMTRMREQPRPQQVQYPEEPRSMGQWNGLEENFCATKSRINIDDPNLADTFNPRAGTITRLNSLKLDKISLVQMSATRMNLNPNAILSPFWNINAHSVVYMIQGRARMQVVNNLGRSVFDGVLRPGQLLIVPQHYAVLKKAKREGCQCIAFKTNVNSMVSHIAGKNSILRAMPVDVIANAYRISREEARSLKNNRGQEIGAFEPRLQQERYQSFPEGQYPAANETSE